MNSKASKMMKMGMFSSGRDRRYDDDYRRHERDYEPREHHRGYDYDGYDRDYRDGDYRDGRSSRRMRDEDCTAMTGAVENAVAVNMTMITMMMITTLEK